MKKIYALLFFLPILICGAQEKQNQSKHVILKESVEKHMNYLASDALEGRKTGSEGLEKAAVYMESFFRSHDIKPFFQTYRDSFKLKGLVGYNIVGYIEGQDPMLKNEFVILGAHYDHIGFARKVNGDTIANGANDDASGTVAVLEWAKYFAKTKSNKRSILFTLYDAEEMGLKGSEHLANRLKKQPIDLYTMINFEMIGVPLANHETMAYITGYKKSNMANQLNSYAHEELIGFLPQAKAYGLFKRSDNYPFYKTFKVPAQAISTFDFSNYEYYHHVDDEVEALDFDHMTTFIQKMIPALEGMINSEKKEITLHE
ncbi:M28 family metallopeptidase [Pseudotamlana carrageenivorans]|uniref:Peptidase M28 n=1 Tax=Pseudotamlana carrageenivorans TaxID=2069432 RepID=A0A2I7SFL2_9FLAO|nr:M20/M25/M40 family metallo-hydrolase [Tamlana carrageenivorans]AUS04702.1 peptidase M28 [Tamlana carrageenivorans]